MQIENSGPPAAKGQGPLDPVVVLHCALTMRLLSHHSGRQFSRFAAGCDGIDNAQFEPATGYKGKAQRSCHKIIVAPDLIRGPAAFLFRRRARGTHAKKGGVPDQVP